MGQHSVNLLLVSNHNIRDKESQDPIDRILTYTRVQSISLLGKHELSRLGPCCPPGGITRRDDPLRVYSFDDDFDAIVTITRLDTAEDSFC